MSGPESSKPDDQLLDEFLAGQGAVRAVYRESASERAPAHLDAVILQAAQAAARPLPRQGRSRWQMPIVAAAVLVLSFGVLLQVQRDPAVQQEVFAVSEQGTPAAAPAPPAATADAGKAEVPSDSAAALEQAPAEKKRVQQQAAARLKPAPRVEKREAAEADRLPPPAPPPPPVMADAPAAAAAPLPAAAPEREAVAAEPPEAAAAARQSAVAGAMAQESMQRRERSTEAAAAKAQASRSLNAAAAFAAPMGATTADDQQQAACPELRADQTPVLASAAEAIAAARPLLIQRFGAEHMARHEPLQAEQGGQRWLVFGSMPAGAAGEPAVSRPQAELCSATGALLGLRQQPVRQAE